MAIMVPENVTSGTTAGEREVFNAFKKHLPEDWIVYHNPVVRGKEMDFVVIAKNYGIVVIEVKDYLLKNLVSINQKSWKLSTVKHDVKCPLQQATDYARIIETCLKTDEYLVNKQGSFKGRLKFPYGAGVILTRFSETDCVKSDIQEIIPSNKLITQTDLKDEEWLAQNLFDKVVSMLEYTFGRASLDEEEMKRIRYHLFPEVRIGASDFMYSEEGLKRFRTLKAMDLYQERAARAIGSGHRLIRGPAGSGKTLILAARSILLLKRNPDWKILVLSTGTILANSISDMLSEMKDREGEQQISGNISVLTFSVWALQDFKCYDVANIEATINMILDGVIGPVKYDAILIDEGQDFKEEWYKLVVLCLNKETGALLIAEDRAQNIFRRKVSFLKQVGLDFRGRSTVLKMNYRNTKQVADFAWRFYEDVSKMVDNDKDDSSDSDLIIRPEVSIRTGPEPFVKRVTCYSDQVNWTASLVLKMIEKNEQKSEICILYRAKKMGQNEYVKPLVDLLEKHKVPVSWDTMNNKSKKGFTKSEDTVKILSLDSSKGIDFKYVIIVNCENVPLYFLKGDEILADISRMYVGMTRATQGLFMLYSGQSLVTEWLDMISAEREESKMKLF